MSNGLNLKNTAQIGVENESSVQNYLVMYHFTGFDAVVPYIRGSFITTFSPPSILLFLYAFTLLFKKTKLQI